MRSAAWVRRRIIFAATVAALVIAAGVRPIAAQDLEPRAYSASPVGTTFLVVGITRSNGSVFTDPSVPFHDVRAKLGVISAGVGHTFSLFTRTALVLGAAPYARGTASGRIEETTREVTRMGWGDVRAKLSINLIGGRALRPAEFVKAPRSTIVGVSLTTILPTGQYYPDRLVNIGSNRWSFKPEVGVSVPVQRWTFDAYVGAWFFTANDEFFPGTSSREQDPVVATQGHVSYTIRPRLWLAFDATWYSGGTTTVDGVDKGDLQRNSRIGGSISIPLGQRQSVKVAYSAGATTRFGGDFKTIAVAWQMAWIR